MMKISILSLIVLFTFSTFAQEADSRNNIADKNVQAGLSLTTGMLFTNFETSTIEGGFGGFIGLGFGANFKLTNNIGLFSGLEFHFEGFRYKPTSGNNFYYDYSDREILQKDDNAAAKTLLLNERRQSTVAANIPLMLLFRSNMIGYFRYFGKFGLRNSITFRQRVNDVGRDILAPSESIKLTGMRAQGDMFFLRSAGGIAGGTEWNFASNTSLSLELGFYYGFSPVFSGNGKDDRNSSSLYTQEINERTYKSFKANQSVFEFKAIVLF